MRRHRFAKIVATLGPASSEPAMLEKLFAAGVDVFRLNFSHGSHEQQKNNIDNLRRLEKQYDRPITILQDLQGPKFRVGLFKNNQVKLQKGQTFRFDNNKEQGDHSRVYLPHPEIFAAAKVGDRLLIDDARTCFEVLSNNGSEIDCRHIYGKAISNNKGVNMPDTVLDVPVLTKKDEEDLAFGLANRVDYVALSFVQKASDMAYLREKVGQKAAILAKIEKPSAVEDIEGILQNSDAIMVARGDLGVEFPPQKLPSIQKTLIHKARKVGKPVIVATQMLESMIESPVATRAEATDVDAAVSSGADAVMLSGETAMGKYPLEAVRFMNEIIMEAEKDHRYKKRMKSTDAEVVCNTEGAIAQGVKAVVNAMPIVAIACFTASGGTAIRLVKERALTPVIAMTPGIHLARRLQLYWGIDAGVVADIKRFRTVTTAAVSTVKNREYGNNGDWVVVTVGVPFGHSGNTNTLRLAQIGEEGALRSS
ncbi:MAG: pyruvate kinase [Gammaproteobacteria bacterium]|nr:MAG: pyruvate kinase [Gammaproteobacteria bacterium]